MQDIKGAYFEPIYFKYESHACDCKIINDESYQLLPDLNRPLTFSYAARHGLVRVNSHNGSVEHEDLLGDIISLNTDDSHEIAAFFREHGFLFPISLSGETVKIRTVKAIIKRLKALADLLSSIHETRKDYPGIYRLIAFFLFSEDIVFKTDAMQTEYKSCHYGYRSFLSNLPEGYPPSRIADASIGSYYLIDDTLAGSYKVDIVDFLNLEHFSAPQAGAEMRLYQRIADAFVKHEAQDANKCINDLFFHFSHDVGLIDISDNFSFHQKPVLENITEPMKKRLIDIAKLIINNEINSNIVNIHPVYDIEEIEQSYRSPSFLNAVYYSVFFLRPEMKLYRTCVNPKCHRRFLVKTTTTRKRFCSEECCNRVTQDRYRRRIRAKKER